MKLPQIIPFLLLLLSAAGTIVPASAQVVRGYGVKLGVTSSDVRSPALDLGGETPITFDTRRRVGIAALAYLEWLNLPALSMVTEAGYVQRGFATVHPVRDAQNNPAGMIRLATRFDYISLAALVKARVPNGALEPYATAGPRLDIFVGGSPTEGLASAYSLTAFGGTAGVGLEVPDILPLSIFAEIRYNFDVTNSLPDVPRDAYNNAIDVLVGVRL